MITSADVRERNHKRPFSPYRIITSSGQTYNVVHPEFLTIGKRYLILGLPIHESEGKVGSAHWISVMHITALEAVEQIR